MQYIAHIGIKLTTPHITPIGEWVFIKETNSIKYYWQINHDDVLHIISGNYSDPNLALIAAKRMYVTVFYDIILHNISTVDTGCDSYSHQVFDDITVDGYNGNEKFFFWPLNYNGGEYGLGVYETDQDVSCFDSKRTKWLDFDFLHKIHVELNSIDETVFTYDAEIQRYFNTIYLAEKADSYGLKMTFYCILLEHLGAQYLPISDDNQSKDEEVLGMIDVLQDEVNNSNLNKTNKKLLCCHLEAYKQESSKNKIRRICQKYASTMYQGKTLNKIINLAYNYRCAFAHGDNTEAEICNDESDLIKNITLDVLMNIMREKEGLEIIYNSTGW